MSQLNEIEDRVQKVEEVATKKVPMYGRVLKEEDYEVLKEHAKASVKYKVLADNLQVELEKKQQEVAQLKADKQKDHDQVRGYYQEIQEENEHLNAENKVIKANLERLADEKAEEMTKEKINNSGIVKQYKQVVTQYKELGDRAEDFRKKAEDLVNTKDLLIKNLTSRMDDLKSNNEFYQNENKELESINKAQSQEINSLKSRIQEFQKQIMLMLNAQLNRVKTLLNIHNVDRKTINALDQEREKFVGESLEKFAIQNQKRQQGTVHEPEMY
jgi:chromosome segregation ATPase